MKKWITKKEISEILQNYSIQKNEFQQLGDSEHYYQSKYVKGYVISFSEEQQSEEKTGRVIVSHTNTTGKKTFNDIWERKDGNMQFQYRNPWNMPTSDFYYLKDLEKENEQLRQAGRELQNKLKEYQKLNNNTEYIKELEQQNRQLKAENEKLQSQINNTSLMPKIHNARGAGRKPSQERLNAIEAVREMLNNGSSEQEIMKRLKISRATFFRYKKCIKN